ncbi:MAG TPA: phosphate transport system regulatory protein PhoU [Ruminococcaceae bacterium]|nr:phosphate transport system regulatory protein PhoU [Oscillospiraceae bacterium]HCD82140.1 phosphate transport system regulatory protein PhoU [Oscillospiraceae bacterium]
MRNKFDHQLEKLNLELITMGALCEDAISASVKGLLDDNDELCQKAVSTEEEINRKERDIESICMKLLLEQQPVARDLRVISSALKMISDMERIGDQAYDIAEIAKFIKNSNVKSRVHIKEMAAAAIKMVTDSVDSFVKKDIELARAVMDYDDKVDNLFNCIKDELVQLISEDRANGEFCIDLLMIAKYLERIGDHAVNIAEWVEYSITGTHR